MELHQLRYFVAVAHSGSFTRAAQHCQVSQPALSQQIQKLELDLRQPLFHRLGRHIRLTEAGRRLLSEVLPVLRKLEEAAQALRGNDPAAPVRLALGAIPTIGPYVLPEVLPPWSRQFPEAELTIREDVTAALVAALGEGELDLALLALPVEDPRLEAFPLVSEPLWVALPPDHPLARRPQVTLDDLARERFILLGEMHCLADQVLAFCHAHDCHPTIACTSLQLGTIQQLIALGQGISLLPELAKRADRSGQIQYRKLAGHAPSRTLAVVRHRRHASGPGERAMLAALREWGKRSGLAPPGRASHASGRLRRRSKSRP
jgi:LysR family hydrogen peroxide-inducible transcriptional activator